MKKSDVLEIDRGGGHCIHESIHSDKDIRDDTRVVEKIYVCHALKAIRYPKQSAVGSGCSEIRL